MTVIAVLFGIILLGGAVVVGGMMYLGFQVNQVFEGAQVDLTKLTMNSAAMDIEIQALTTGDGAKSAVDLQASLPEDAWGNTLIYIPPTATTKFDLVSYGADGKIGGTDLNADISYRQMVEEMENED